MNKKVYLDYNSTTPMDPSVIEAVSDCMVGEYGNPSSIHSFGMSARSVLDEARETVAELIGAKPREIVFTSGGSESNNFALIGAAYSLAERGRHLITTRVEHASVLETFKFLEKVGFEVTYLNVDQAGKIDCGELSDSIKGSSILVSVMYANNETGVIMPVKEVSEIAQKNGLVFHCDAVQALGKVKVDLSEIPFDLMSISSHKICGPKGVGALIIKSGLAITPFIHGGGQERGRRSGTENVPGIAGFGKAVELIAENMEAENKRIRALRDELLKGISSTITRFRINGDPVSQKSQESGLLNTLNISFDGVNGEAVVMALDIEGVAVSTGSACSEGNVDASHVLLAMGLSEDEALGSVRFSLGRFTTTEEINIVLDILPRVISRIRTVESNAGG